MSIQENKEQATSKQRGHEDSLEQRNKEEKGQNIEPQAEEWNTQQPPDRDKKSPNS
jgi:hypothetical protein